MKVLVIDDTQRHLTTATQTLEGEHDVTICASYDEALKLLDFQYKVELIEECLREYTDDRGFIRDGFDDAKRLAEEEARLPYWDAVLCDLLMPAGSHNGVCSAHVGEEMPVGWALALVAAQRGAKFVAVATDMNHHDHPASAMLDRLQDHLFTINNAKVLFANMVPLIGISGTEYQCRKCDGHGLVKCTGGEGYECYECDAGIAHTQKGKNWGYILKTVMA